MEKVPHGEHDDILQKPDASAVAYGFESFLVDCYVKKLFALNDDKVKMALRELSFLKYENSGQELKNDSFFGMLTQVYDAMMTEGKHDGDLVGKVILRLLMSIRNISGGYIGKTAYLRYLQSSLT